MSRVLLLWIGPDEMPFEAQMSHGRDFFHCFLDVAFAEYTLSGSMGLFDI